MQCGQRTLDLTRPRVMGILNATPDSFSDGGRFSCIDHGLQHALNMIGEGAHIIDIGGESTRPGAQPITEQEEMDRVLPLLEAISAESDVLLSVDTSSPRLITESARCGAHLINDVRALQRPGALAAAAATQLPVCLMHMQGEPATMQQGVHYDDVVSTVIDFLQGRIVACERAGIARQRIMIDPGFGFGKTVRHNYQLLERLAELNALGVPLLTGLSRKAMIGYATGQERADQRVIGSVAGALLCVLQGASIVRVHDVGATVQALAVVQAMRAVRDTQ